MLNYCKCMLLYFKHKCAFMFCIVINIAITAWNKYMQHYVFAALPALILSP